MNLLNQLNTNNSIYNYELRDYFYKKYIKTYNNNEDENGNMRVIFTANKFKSDFSINYVKECNGLILNYNKNDDIKWKLLSIPPACINMNNLSIAKINEYYQSGKYKITKVIDGSLITLYYYNDDWRISSNSGYDITDMIFCNNFTWKQVISEISPNFDYSILDVNKCYSICIRYSNYHIFDERCNETDTNSYITFIQAVDINTGKIYYENILNKFTNNIESIVNNENNINQIINRNKNSYNSYKQSIDCNNYLKYKPNYGYILRSTTTDEVYKNIYLESNLMKFIRLSLYNKKIPNTIQNNLLYITLHTYLNFPSYNYYKFIFRQFTKFYETYNVLINTTIPNIINNSTVINNKLDINSDLIKKYELNNNIDKLQKLCLFIINKINDDSIHISQQHPFVNEIITDYIHHLSFIDAYYEYFN